MSFANPLALLLLLAVPYVVWLGWPRSAVRRNRREWASLALRLLIVMLLVLGLAGAQTVRAADDLAVVFLVDASDSIDAEEAEAAESFVRAAIETMGVNDQAAVVVFGGNALVERPMSGLAELAPVTSAPQALHTDLAEAIRLGLAIFPAGSARRMVLLSDGRATIGDTAEAARLAAAAGVEIDIVPLTGTAVAEEAMIVAVDAPTRVGEGESFTIEVTIESTAAMPATLRVLAGGTIIHESVQQLNVGSQRIQIPLRATAQEFARYRVQLSPAQDTFYQNNELAAFTEIVGPPRVLLVANDGTLDDEGNPQPDEAPQLRSALQAAGIQVEQTTPAELPAGLAELSNYASVILVNVNAKNLSPRKMEALQTYVRDLGGGLVAVGGPQSYGVGGYFRTALEETLPVDMQLKDQERFPSVSIAIVIDRSGSMAATEGGLTKIQLANEAAVQVVELLNDFDEITVIPVDTQPSNVVGPVSAADKGAIIDQIRQIGAGGGGINVRTGVEAAALALAGSFNQVRHIIVLADGADSNEKGGVPALIESLVDEGVTVSMVAIGDGNDVPWLQDMAELGDGRFHFTDRAANLPQIFTQETTAIQRSYLIEERFFPAAGPDYRLNPMLRNIRQVPPLMGYVGTTPKGAAQILLETHQGDPLLAAWQYGLGRAVAWTSDATGRWAGDWVQWGGFATFWAQAVRWTISAGRDNNVETAVDFSGETARLTVDARDGRGGYLNDLALEANVVAPSGRTTGLTLQQVAPGRYEAQFTPEEEGAYFIRAAGATDDEATAVGQTSGWVLGYSPEYQALEPDPALLTGLANLTGGRELTAEPEAVFNHNLPAERATRPIWPWLTVLAVVLLPLDVGLRRLVITRRDVAQAWETVAGRLRPSPAAVERSEQVARLFQAKERADVARNEATAVTPERPLEVKSTTQPAEEQKRPSPPPTSSSESPSTDSGDGSGQAGALAARLLARRQGRRPPDADPNS